MSTTAVRMNSPHIPSSAYVPRSSRPSSPSLPPPPAHLPAPPNRHHSYSHHNYGNGNKHSSSNNLSHGHGSSSHQRSASAPGSPALTPRMQDMERRGSSNLRHEVTGAGTGLDNGRKAKLEDMSEGARAILKMLSSLPAPLPESLPATFLPSPDPTPSPPSHRSFADYVRTGRKRKAETAIDSTSSEDEGAAGDARDGLGLGISLAGGSVKRHKAASPRTATKDLSASTASTAGVPKSPELARSASTSSVPARTGDRSLTPAGMGASPALGQKTLGKSALRNEVDGGVQGEDGGEDMGTWSKEKFLETGAALRARALLLKRHGDAYQRSPTAQPKYISLLPADPLRGLLCLTDAVLLWLFAYWLEEQTSTRIRASPYNESQPLREFVRRGWESEMRKAGDEAGRERARAMVGLMHLIESVVCYHLNSEQLAHISRKTKELNQQAHQAHQTRPAAPPTSAPHQNPSPASSHASPGTNPSPHASTGGTSTSSPDSHTSTSTSTATNQLTDLLPIITTSTSATHRAQTYLLTSRHHLSLGKLRTLFPRTWTHAIHSELSDEALPAPGDSLGAAKRLEVDVVGRFSWPVELGMHCPVAHAAVFGRCLVWEFGEGVGGWDVAGPGKGAGGAEGK